VEDSSNDARQIEQSLYAVNVPEDGW
jgi:hypothetical protein